VRDRSRARWTRTLKRPLYGRVMERIPDAETQ
jgi:hypothetical protein